MKVQQYVEGGDLHPDPDRPDILGRFRVRTHLHCSDGIVIDHSTLVLSTVNKEFYLYGPLDIIFDPTQALILEAYLIILDKVRASGTLTPEAEARWQRWLDE